MDSQETKTGNFELPRPAGEAAPMPGMSAPEQGPAPEMNNTPGGSGPADGTTTATAMPNPATMMGASTPPTATVSGHVAGLPAEDADLIEKVWVEKAKQIVSETHGDPFNQNKEINKVKADYIKKRYNKDIKLASE